MPAISMVAYQVPQGPGNLRCETALIALTFDKEAVATDGIPMALVVLCRTARTIEVLL